MSIADKITSITTHLEADYEGLENIGADLTNIDKNIYNIRTCLDNIYTNLPKTTGEGSNLSLTTLKGRINVDDILGDTTQEGTPTPSSPQDINVVTGTQEVVVQNANILDTSEIKVVKNQIGDNRNGYYCKINTTGTYTLLLNTANTMYFGKSTNLESATTLIGSASATYTTNYTFNEGEYFVIWGTKTDTDKLMVALGTSLPYIEHQEQTQQLHLGDIELAKIDTYQDRIFETSGKNLFGGTLYNGQVGSNGGWTSGANRITNISANGVLSDFYLEQGTYTISIPKLDTCSLLTKDASGTILDNYATQWNNLPFTFTLTQAGYVSFTGRKTDNSNISPSDYVVMINKGSTALPYEPYGSDKWYIEKNIGKVNLENIPWTGATTASGYKLYVTEQIRDIKYVSANTIVGEGLAYNYIMHTGNGMSHPSALNCIAIDTNAVRVQTTSQAPTGIFYYALTTPTYEEITNETLKTELNEIEKMMSYNGQTNISVSGNLPMLLSVSALKGE